MYYIVLSNKTCSTSTKMMTAGRVWANVHSTNGESLRVSVCVQYEVASINDHHHQQGTSNSHHTSRVNKRAGVALISCPNSFTKGEIFEIGLIQQRYEKNKE